MTHRHLINKPPQFEEVVQCIALLLQSVTVEMESERVGIVDGQRVGKSIG